MYIYIYTYIYMYVYMYIYIVYAYISRHVRLPAAPRAAPPVPSAVTRELAHPAPGMLWGQGQGWWHMSCGGIACG